MDTSGKYIKMCTKAMDIQQYAPKTSPMSETDADPRMGSLFWSECEKQVFMLHFDNDNRELMIGEYHKPDASENLIWLPRQDQLQDIIGRGVIPHFSYLVTEQDRCNSNVISPFDTLEQQWLVYLMEKKFNKQWNGEDWITNITDSNY